MKKAQNNEYLIKALINKRLVCHYCGTEITHRHRNCICINNNDLIVCDWCYCQFVRRGKL